MLPHSGRPDSVEKHDTTGLRRIAQEYCISEGTEADIEACLCKTIYPAKILKAVEILCAYLGI
jgi:hypothetical protein